MRIKKIESIVYFYVIIQRFQTNKRIICRLRPRPQTFFNSFQTC